MAEARYRHLWETLIRRGLAVRYATRAALELESHFRQQFEELIARGESQNDAEAQAGKALGTDRDLVERYANQTELQAWSHRWPRLGFILIPLLSFTALSIADMVVLICIAKLMAGYLHHVHVPIQVTHGIDAAVQVVFLWMFPIWVSGAFAVIAHRQRVALRFPVVGIVLLCSVVAFVNLQFVITGGPSPGFAGAGMGVSSTTFSHQVLHALITTAIVLIPAIVARLDWQSDNSSFE